MSLKLVGLWALLLWLLPLCPFEKEVGRPSSPDRYLLRLEPHIIAARPPPIRLSRFSFAPVATRM